MKCFQHREADAIGTCRNCSRGLCPECVAVGAALTCKGRCEGEWGVVDRGLKLARARTKVALKAAAVVTFALAASSFYLAGFTRAPFEVQVFLVGIGIAFCLVGLLRIRQVIRWKRADPAADRADLSES